jgi:hypothetical protein
MIESYADKTIRQSSKYILISEVRAVGNRLAIKLDLSPNIRKYFFKDNFVVEYDNSIENADESILSIVPLFVVAPVAWATGADVYVNRLDRTSLNSLHKVRQIFLKWYPKFSFSGRIYVNNLIDNKFNNKQAGLLFSGGLDSLTSYIIHKHEHPVLITLLRGENPSSYEYDYYNRIKDTFTTLAKNEFVDIHFIRTDLWDTYSSLLHNQLLARDFNVIDWWNKVSHGLILLGLSAPLSIEGIGRLYLASSHVRDYEVPQGQGSHFLANIDFSWADVKVIYDVQDLTRYGKIKYVLRGNHYYYRYLKVCSPFVNPSYYKNSNSQEYVKNCGFCHKCIKTITGLILESIDPAECNFYVDDKVLYYVKRLLTTGSLPLKGSQREHWEDIQRQIPDKISNTPVMQRYGGKEFFEWLREFDFSSYKFCGNTALQMLCWTYCLVRYRGFYYTIKLLVSIVRRSPIAGL